MIGKQFRNNTLTLAIIGQLFQETRIFSADSLTELLVALEKDIEFWSLNFTPGCCHSGRLVTTDDSELAWFLLMVDGMGSRGESEEHSKEETRCQHPDAVLLQ